MEIQPNQNQIESLKEELHRLETDLLMSFEKLQRHINSVIADTEGLSEANEDAKDVQRQFERTQELFSKYKEVVAKMTG